MLSKRHQRHLQQLNCSAKQRCMPIPEPARELANGYFFNFRFSSSISLGLSSASMLSTMLEISAGICDSTAGVCGVSALDSSTSEVTCFSSVTGSAWGTAVGVAARSATRASSAVSSAGSGDETGACSPTIDSRICRQLAQAAASSASRTTEPSSALFTGWPALKAEASGCALLTLSEVPAEAAAANASSLVASTVSLATASTGASDTAGEASSD